MESLKANELSEKLEKALDEYDKTPGSKVKRQALLEFLKINDCRELISKSVDGDKVSNAFTLAGMKNHPDILQAFLDRGMNIDNKNEHGNTALMFASIDCRVELVKLLLDQNANPDIQDNNGWTALLIASQVGHTKIVQLLLDHGADIDLKSNFNFSAHSLAATKKIKKMIENHVNTSYILK